MVVSFLYSLTPHLLLSTSFVPGAKAVYETKDLALVELASSVKQHGHEQIKACTVQSQTVTSALKSLRQGERVVSIEITHAQTKISNDTEKFRRST